MTDSWSKNLCGCCGDYEEGNGCALCLMGSCCPCFIMGRTMYRVQHPNMDPDKLERNPCNADCAVVCVLHSLGAGLGWHIFGWAYNTCRRGDVREQYGIKGNCCGDCMTSWCCSLCALVQQERESAARHRYKPINNVVVDQPGAQMPMQPPPVGKQ